MKEMKANFANELDPEGKRDYSTDWKDKSVGIWEKIGITKKGKPDLKKVK